MLTIKKLQEIKDIFNVAELARKADINRNTLVTKIKTGKELSVTESLAITNVLKEYSIFIKDE